MQFGPYLSLRSRGARSREKTWKGGPVTSWRPHAWKWPCGGTHTHPGVGPLSRLAGPTCIYFCFLHLYPLAVGLGPFGNGNGKAWISNSGMELMYPRHDFYIVFFFLKGRGKVGKISPSLQKYSLLNIFVSRLFACMLFLKFQRTGHGYERMNTSLISTPPLSPY